VFVATADDLRQQVRRVRIVAEVANFVDGDQRGFSVTPEAPLERNLARPRTRTGQLTIVFYATP
jgi:hypothetical protein